MTTETRRPHAPIDVPTPASGAEIRPSGADPLQGLDEAIERRAQELTAALQGQVNELSRMVAHDLREPLRAIDGFSHLLLEEYGARLDPEGRRYLARVRGGVQKLGQLLDGMGRLLAVQQRQLQPGRIDLTALAGRTLDNLAGREPGRGVEFRVQPGLEAEGDPVLVGLALRKLLGNAWKFTRGRSPARIEVGVLEGGSRPIFFVRDNGPGFDPAVADLVFGPFRTAGGHHPGEGLGLGLTIARDAIRRHGGRIWAEPMPGRGLTVFYTLAPAGSRSGSARRAEEPA